MLLEPNRHFALTMDSDVYDSFICCQLIIDIETLHSFINRPRIVWWVRVLWAFHFLLNSWVSSLLLCSVIYCKCCIFFSWT